MRRTREKEGTGMAVKFALLNGGLVGDVRNIPTTSK
jgi:hypothetical protein